MDAATKGFWEKVVHELEHLNKTLDKMLQIVERPRQKYEPANGNQSSPADKANSTGGEMPIQLHIRPGPEHQSKPQTKWYQTSHGWKKVLEPIGIGFAILYALVTVYIARINYQQWQDSQKGFKDARQSFKDARTNFEYDERSWAKISYAWPKQENLKLPIAPYCDATFTNVGKSVITALHGVATVEVLAKDGTPDFMKPRSSTPGNIFTKGPMFPTETESFHFQIRDKNYDPRQFTPEEVADLMSGSSYMITWGYVAYKDSFGTHWYRFCDYRLYVGEAGMIPKPCVTWNVAVGEGEAPPGFQAMAW